MIELSPSLDAQVLSEAYSVRKRLQVRDFLTEPSAEHVLKVVEQTPWGIAFNEGANVVQLDAAALTQLTPEDNRNIATGIHQRAQRGYQFLYSYFPLFSAYFTPGHPRMPLFEVFEFLNSEPLLRFVRDLTGLHCIRWTDGQATLFRAGHFLKCHTDEVPAERRAAAYVLNLTKSWERDWGGYLQFFNERYDIEEGYRPIFNALNIFTVPADHSVSMVASYAPGSRYSITGWFREDAPPGPIGRS